MNTRPLREIEEELVELSYDAGDFDEISGDRLRAIARKLAVQIELIELNGKEGA